MNIVLIGMPGSGKSTVGALVAAATGRTFLETDALVEAREGCTISALFAARGESYFRDVEAAVAQEVARAEHAVIATGGGMVLRKENMVALAAGGTVFFLDRAPHDIATEHHAARPLLADDADAIFALYAQRIALYEAYAQHRIPAGASPNETAARLLEAIEREGLQ